MENIICPECQELSIINNNDDFFSLKCPNNHEFSDITITSLIDSQYIEESSIKCHKCNNCKYYYNKFYAIYSSQSNEKYIMLCPLCCDSYENKNSNLIDYDYRYCICSLHNSKYISYCQNCNKNLCIKCEKKHTNHEIILFKEKLRNKKRVSEIKNEKEKINECINKLDNLKEKFENIIINTKDYLNKYNILYKYIIKSKDNAYNYQSINNMINFNTQNLIKKINEILNDNNLENNFNKIFNLYERKKV